MSFVRYSNPQMYEKIRHFQSWCTRCTFTAQLAKNIRYYCFLSRVIKMYCTSISNVEHELMQLFGSLIFLWGVHWAILLDLLYFSFPIFRLFSFLLLNRKSTNSIQAFTQNPLSTVTIHKHILWHSNSSFQLEQDIQHSVHLIPDYFL
jgi:hypothetical protein